MFASALCLSVQTIASRDTATNMQSISAASLRDGGEMGREGAGREGVPGVEDQRRIDDDDVVLLRGKRCRR